MNQQMKLTRLSAMLVCAMLRVTILSAQYDKDKIYYEAIVINMVATDMTGKKELLEQPMGKKVFIAYDKIFKKYFIGFNRVDGKEIFMELNYRPEIGVTFPNAVRVKDVDTGDYFYLIDQLSTKGSLKMLNTTSNDDMLTWFIVKNAKLINTTN